jgi:Ca-activated chloride channel family protein
MSRFPALAAALALLPAGLAAQQPSPSPPPPIRLEVDVDVVSVTAVVQDKAGRFVSGLGPRDIEVLEDGVRQDVSFFQEAKGAEHIPLSLALVLDCSGSMKPQMHFLQEAAVSLLHKLDEGDRALIISFNESVKGSSEFTADMDRMEQSVAGLQAWGGTSLYDAVHYGLNRVRDQPGRKVVVVFSDGADTTSSMKDAEVIDYARAVEATVYTVGIKGESGLFGRGPRGFLRRLSRETGGTYYFPDKVSELVRTFNEIATELQHHYLLAYTPRRAPDGSWRAIEVRVKRADTDLRVRKGYFAMKRTRAAQRPDPTASPAP